MGAGVTAAVRVGEVEPVRFEASLRPCGAGRAWLDVIIVSGGVARHLGSTLMPAEEAAAGAVRLTGATAEEERERIVALLENCEAYVPRSAIDAIKARGATKGEAA